MSKKRRPKSENNHIDMSHDNQDKDLAVTATDVTTIEPDDETPVIADEPAMEDTQAVEAPAVEIEPVVEAPAITPSTTSIAPSDVLLGVFSKRVIGAIDPTLWANAVNAVRQGRTVVLRGGAPHIDITDEVFNSDGELPTGISSPVSILNNLLSDIV